ncbi:MAG: hypothetical protein FJ298_10965 [Planctomycetes bacterium]|nr:hypothetical protein [Planctomycetota bacterium]
MRRENYPICFQCGQATGDLTRFNRLHDGRACPACAERLLAALPSLLPRHSAPAELAAALETNFESNFESNFEANREADFEARADANTDASDDADFDEGA